MFATIRGEGGSAPLVWVVDRLTDARPRVVEVRGAISFHDLMEQAGLPRHRDAAAVNGLAWDGQPRSFHDGDVVYACLYAAMRGEYRWRYHLRTLSLDSLRQTFPRSALLAFPVLGPVVVPLVQPGRALSPAEQHAHVSLRDLLNHFREALRVLRDSVLQQGPHQVVYAGPGIPAFRVGVPFAVSDLDAAAAFFRNFLEPYFGRREIFGTGHHLTNACVIAALPPGDSSCTWLVPEGCGVDSFPGDSEGSMVHTREVIDGMILSPRVLFGRLGICWHRDLADPCCGRVTTPNRPPLHGRLLPSGLRVDELPASGSQPTPVHACLSGPARVPVLQPAPATLSSSSLLEHSGARASTAPRPRSRSPAMAQAVSSAPDDEADASGVALLQLRALKKDKITPVDTVATFRPKSTDDVWVAVWTLRDGHSVFSIASDASAFFVSDLLATELGSSHSAQCLVPVFPVSGQVMHCVSLADKEPGVSCVVLCTLGQSSTRQALNVSPAWTLEDVLNALGWGQGSFWVSDLPCLGPMYDGMHLVFRPAGLDIQAHHFPAASSPDSTAELRLIVSSLQLPWLDFWSRDFEAVTLPPEIRGFLLASPAMAGHPLEFCVFTDGSASSSAAGWGAVLFGLFGSLDSPFWAFVGFAGGNVTEDGRPGTNNQAEGSALLHVLTWALSLPPFLPLSIVSDSALCVRCVNGEAKPPCGKARASVHHQCRYVKQAHEAAGRNLVVSWTRSHWGTAGNECADKVAEAFAGRLTELCSPVPSAARRLWGHRLLPWAWMLWDHAGLPSLDLFADSAYESPEKPALSCVSAILDDVALCKAPETGFRLRLCSANVCSLLHKQHLLTHQLDAHLVSICGLQETRYGQDTVFQSDGWICFHSRGIRGHKGCAFWAHGGRLAAAAGLSQGPGREHFVVLQSREDWLAVRLRWEILDCIFVTLHAPHTGYSEDARRSWWAQAGDDLQRLGQVAPLVFYLGTSMPWSPPLTARRWALWQGSSPIFQKTLQLLWQTFWGLGLSTPSLPLPFPVSCSPLGSTSALITLPFHRHGFKGPPNSPMKLI